MTSNLISYATFYQLLNKFGPYHSEDRHFESQEMLYCFLFFISYFDSSIVYCAIFPVPAMMGMF